MSQKILQLMMAISLTFYGADTNIKLQNHAICQCAVGFQNNTEKQNKQMS